MSTVIQQPGVQSTATAIKKATWAERRAEKVAAKLAARAARVAAPSPAPHELSFYERAIEWTHRADKIINLVLGYLLAIASVLGFMDVLSNGQVLNQVPFMFYVWLGIMGLGVDFQILLVIGRIPDLFHMSVAGWQKWLIFLFNIAFLVFLCIMSVVISAVFTQHRDMPSVLAMNAAHKIVSRESTIGDAMTTLGINDILFVYGRAALATLLLVLMAVDRTMERWRMQITATAQHVANATQQVIQQITPVVAAPAPVQASDLDKILLAIVDMNAQNIQAMRDLNTQTITQFSQISVSVMEETLSRVTATLSLPGTPQWAQIAQGEQEGEQGEQKQQVSGDTGPMALPGKPSQGEQEKAFKHAVERLVKAEPNLTDREIADRVGCSTSTANKWKKACKAPVQA